MYNEMMGDIKHTPYRNNGMSDEPQFVILLPEMVHQQREPDDQGRGADDDCQGDQAQIYFAGETMC